MKSSRVFFIQRGFLSFWLHSTPNTWIGHLDKLLTTKHFPCLKKLEVKDDSMDEIRITIEIIKEKAIIKKCGPIHGGKYFKKRSKK